MSLTRDRARARGGRARPRTRPRTARRCSTCRTRRCPRPTRPPRCASCPTWDATLLVHARRTLILPEAHPRRGSSTSRCRSRSGRSWSTAQVAGTWRPSGDASSRSRADARHQRPVDAEAARLADVHRLTLYVGAVHADRSPSSSKRRTRTRPTCCSCPRRPPRTGRRSSPTPRCARRRGSRGRPGGRARPRAVPADRGHGRRAAAARRGRVQDDRRAVGARRARVLRRLPALGDARRGDRRARSCGSTSPAFDRLHEHEPALAHLMLRDLARILALRLRLASAVIADLRGS